MANISFLQNSSFGFLIEELQGNFNNKLLKPLNNYNLQITNLTDNFLRLATKAFGFNVIENFLQDGKKFFNALPTITTFEGFIDLVESIFLSREVTVTYLTPAKISLTIHNHNTALLSKYVDEQQKEYIDNASSNYYGFKEQDFLGLESFFKKFLQPFLPAGVVLESVTLKVKTPK